MSPPPFFTGSLIRLVAHFICGQRGGPLRMAIWTPREPKAMTPLSLKSIWCTGPSAGGWARKEVYFWRLFPKKEVTRPYSMVRGRMFAQTEAV